LTIQKLRKDCGFHFFVSRNAVHIMIQHLRSEIKKLSCIICYELIEDKITVNCTMECKGGNNAMSSWPFSDSRTVDIQNKVAVSVRTLFTKTKPEGSFS
jgi:hypothetical protein